MRLRSISLIIVAGFLVWGPAASAQKRIFSTVNPNEAFVNKTADIFDPNAGSITAVPHTMNVARERHIAVPLFSGKVLIAGGYNNRHLRDAEIFDPEHGTFTVTDDMRYPRSGAAAVRLDNGNVMILGGYNGNYLQSVDIYDPATGEFSILSIQMTIPRQNPNALLLKDGTVLVTGGDIGTAFLANAERYNPADRKFSSTLEIMHEPREGHAATLLSDGKVLVTGGCNNTLSSEIVCNNFLASAEIFDPATSTFTYTGSMTVARKNHVSVLLPNGKVLIAGGTDGKNVLNSAEIFDPQTGVFTATGSMDSARLLHTASALSNGKILIAGGQSGEYYSSMELYDPSSGTFSLSAAAMSAKRASHTATILSTGQVLLTGGKNRDLLSFDINVQRSDDNIAPNLYFSPDSKFGFVPYTGSGVVAIFETGAGTITKILETGGKPFNIVPIPNEHGIAVTSALDKRVFIINTDTQQVEAVHSFENASFGFGSIPAISPDGTTGYLSSTATGTVLKFNVKTGQVLGQLTNLKAPAQITLSRDGSTLFIVDTIAGNVVIANAASMAVKSIFDPSSRYSLGSLTIYNKVVLNSDETIAMITIQNSSSMPTTAYSGGLLFNPADGTWILDEDDDDGDGEDDDLDEDEADDGVYGIGYQPGFSMLLPDGKNWLVLSQSALSIVPTIDPRADSSSEINDEKADEGSYVKNYAHYSGAPLPSSNVVLSSDAKFAFYALGSLDRVLQQDVSTGAVVSSLPVGDDPNLSVDQSSSIAFTPDYKVLAVINMVSNEVVLLTDSTVFRQAKYISQQDSFTGLSLINLSDLEADITVTAMTNNGGVYDTDIDTTTTYDDINNPAEFKLAPHEQISVDISVLLGLNNSLSNEGYLVIESTQPVVAGFSAIGKIQSSYLNSYISHMGAVPFYRNYDNYPTDFILPEIPEATGATTELNLVNPNYGSSNYDLVHYSTEGTEQEIKENQSLSAAARTTQALSSVVASNFKGQILITGGVSGNFIRISSEKYSMDTAFSFIGSEKVGRYGHSSTLTPDGNVLLAGGRNGFEILKNAELYYPTASFFRYSPGTMNVERYRHTATRLGNGLILLAGGQSQKLINQTAELFNFVTGKFSVTKGSMTIPRDAHTATRLANGKVLLTGGLDGVGITATAELYDPSTDTFTATGVMKDARAFHSAVLLNDGTVLITGGYNGSYLNSAELYNPETGIFTEISPMTNPRSSHAATMLSDGTVLITGGVDADTVLTGGLDTAEVYDPQAKLFARTFNNMTAHRSMHTATNLLDDDAGDEDNVLILGGYGFDTIVCNTDNPDATETDCNANGIEDAEEVEPGALSSAETYNMATRFFSRTSSNMSYGRQGHATTLLREGVGAGYLHIKSEKGLMAAEIYSEAKGGATTVMNGIDLMRYSGVKSVYSPRFVIPADPSDAAQRRTKLNIINANEDNNADITINLRDFADGHLLATKTLSLNKNAQIKGDLWNIFSNAESLKGKAGWLEVISSVDKVVGTVSFYNANNKYLANFELSGNPMSHFVYPMVSEDSNYETEISLLNTGAKNQVEIELWGATGQKDGASYVIEMPAQSGLTATLKQLFPNMADHQYAYVVVKAGAPIHASGELRYKNLRFIASVPPVVYPE